MAKVSVDKPLHITVFDRLGSKDGPYGEAGIKWIYCTVDHDSNNPWAIKIKTKNNIYINKVTKAYEEVTFKVDSIIYKDPHTWTCKTALFEDINRSGTDYEDEITIKDIRQMPGAPSSIPAHTWYYFNVPFTGSIKSNKGVYSNRTVNISVPLYTPLVTGVGSGVSASITTGNSLRTYQNIKITGKFSGIGKGNVNYTVRLVCGSKPIGSRSGSPSNGTISGNFYTTKKGTYNIKLYMDYTDSAGNKHTVNLKTKSITLKDPDPAPPEMGEVRNTTRESINTTRRKTLSAEWDLDWFGWPQTGTITYRWHCISSTAGEIDSDTTTSKSVSIPYDIPTQQTGCNIYWKVEAKNNTGWSTTAQSGNREIFWAYNEPSKITANKINPNRFQLFNSSTKISPTVYANVNSWGDRPGERTVEFAIFKNGSALKYYGRNKTSTTGTYSQKLSYTVPEADLNQTYNVIAYKRINGTEYTTSSNPKYPTTGNNHVTAGNITFYEVIGRVSGSFSINPTIIIAGLPTKISYNWTYDKQSSEKVKYFIEVYRITKNQVTKTINLESNINSSKNFSNSLSTTLVANQQADDYEIKLKATVTELLGNTHTYTLATMRPEVYNQPVATISLNKLSKSLPTTNTRSSLAKQATDITWNYDYSFKGVTITKAVLTIISNPYGTESVDLPFSASTSPYHNAYTRISKGEFTLGSQVKAYMRLYYQILGHSTVYSVITNTITINITPTRYMYYLTRTSTGERQLNKIHPLVGNQDKTSKKIFIEEK